LARDWHGSGAARNAVPGQVEFGGAQDLTNFAFETSIVRGGGTSLRFTGVGYIESTTGFTRLQEYLRIYMRISGAPTARVHMVSFANAGEFELAAIYLRTDQKIDVQVNNTTVIGIAPFIVTANAWSFFELYLDMNGHIECKQDNSSWLTVNTPITVTGPIDRMLIGPYNANPGITMYFTDYAMNSTTGRYCTSWCGESDGGIRLLVPAADQAKRSDVAWVPQTGSNLWSQIDDLPAATIDTTTYIKQTTGVQSSDANVSLTPLGVDGIVSAMLWGVRGGGTGTTDRSSLLQAQMYTDPHVTPFFLTDVGLSAFAFQNGATTNWNLNGWKTVYPALVLESRLSHSLLGTGLDQYWALSGAMIERMAARIIRMDANVAEIRITAVWAYVDVQRLAVGLGARGLHPRMLLELSPAV
jgi:hypothetical protein